MRKISILLVVLCFFFCDTNSVKPDPDPQTVTDIDGNVYNVIRIGTQLWTAENWRSTKYNDGTAIPHVTDDSAWYTITTPGYCYYNNVTNADTIKKWGALYNWSVVAPTNPKQIAPAGWRVPSDTDWTVLENYLIANGYNWDGSTAGNKIAKSMAAKTDWITDTAPGAIGNDLTKNNRCHFSALPGGYRYYDGNFYYQSSSGYWWSATELNDIIAFFRYLHYNGRSLGDLIPIGFYKSCGFSVRLVRDAE